MTPHNFLRFSNNKKTRIVNQGCLRKFPRCWTNAAEDFLFSIPPPFSSVPQSLSVAHAEDITRCFFLLVPLQQCTRYVVAVVVVIVVSGVYMQEEVSSWCCGCVRWFDDIYSGYDIFFSVMCGFLVGR